MSGTISFIMPAYKSLYLKEAIQSILSQTGKDWELVVVDDCSPEDLGGIVGGFSDGRIKYIRNDRNIGGSNLVAQWNHSLSFASGEWLVLAADDDVYAPEFCETVVSLAGKNPGVDLIRSGVALIDESGHHIWNDPALPEYQNRYEFLNDYLTGRTLSCVGNFAFRLKALRSIGGFTYFPCAFCSDISTPIRLAVNGVANTPEPCFKFRHSSVHLSGDKSRLKDKLDAFNQFYRWLDAFEYEKPESLSDIKNYSIKNSEYLHDKYIYDCFNHVVKFVPIKDLPRYLGMCQDAGLTEKLVMSARWFKSRIFK